jgi:hypothetical protein
VFHYRVTTEAGRVVQMIKEKLKACICFVRVLVPITGYYFDDPLGG